MASSNKTVIFAALAGNALIAVTKFIAAAHTGSSAMWSEGVHSVVDTGNQVLLLYGLRRSQKPADEQFPFGYGKEIYFWSFVVAILIFAVGAGISLYEGIHRIQNPHPIQNAMINYIVLSLAILFEGGAWIFAFNAFRHTKGRQGYIEAVQRGKDPTMFVVLFEDSAAILGLIVALLGVFLTQWTGAAYYDGIASIIIGLILAATSIWLAYETKGLLIGESANKPVVQGIRKVVRTCDNVRHVNEVLTMHMGPDFVLVNVSAEFKDNTSADDIERAIANMDTRIKKQYPLVKRLFVEAEARKPRFLK